MLLLVSVVDPSEVASAIEGGADIIDVKNTREGALGASQPHIIVKVRQQTPEWLPVSAALGDAPYQPGAVSLAALGAVTCGADYVKVGLHGVSNYDQTLHLMSAVRRAVKSQRREVRVIAAAFADAASFGAVAPGDALEAAIAAKSDGFMLDTASKDGSTLFDHCDDEQLSQLIARCHDHGLFCALAGSLRAADSARLANLRPDVVGYRSAACKGDRQNGRVDQGLVAALKDGLCQAGCQLSVHSPKAAAASQGACR